MVVRSAGKREREREREEGEGGGAGLLDQYPTAMFLLDELQFGWIHLRRWDITIVRTLMQFETEYLLQTTYHMP